MIKLGIEYKCIFCSEKISRQSFRCKSCSNKQRKQNRKIDWDKILNYYNNGKSEKEISLITKYKQPTINYVLKKSNVEKRAKDIKGEKNSHWKKGISYDRNRKMIYSPKHPHAKLVGLGKTPYVYEYRLVMEKHIGRFLCENEIIHHKDGDVTNNDINNLELMSQSEHAKLHHRRGDF